MTDTITRFDLVREFLDALDWVNDGRIYSEAPDNDADVWLKRADLEPRCVTAKVHRMCAHGFVERVAGGTGWRLTPDGGAMRDGIRKYAGSTS
jgi:hypothetical protein